ncbi:Histidinol dehydrogenase-2C chloroplastic -like protein [Gossypium arboreum]|uniref:Histidinol dehydrogenase-2C chloroplastic-like protein n=1 Tax=Gossypium arboreum TaxID=29729 RepID=A0A0B0NUP9_GOSAR|nr:Histidinol dehydrogenase-2C chloroplastic -like protein [Gossypium arboreum]
MDSQLLRLNPPNNLSIKPFHSPNFPSFAAPSFIRLSSLSLPSATVTARVPSLGNVEKHGYTEKFDKVELEKIVENVSELPYPELDPTIKEAFDVAYDNIYAFHLAQKSVEKSVENMKGVRCKRVARSIGSVGLYVPGGTAVLPSTALMLSVPAQIAGCKTVVLATPPGQDGNICKEVLYCAKKAGVTHILKAGGAQAISAMAWGTESCPKNSEAMISIDMPAGPSEVLVIADKLASPVHIAADLLSQAYLNQKRILSRSCQSDSRNQILLCSYSLTISWSRINQAFHRSKRGDAVLDHLLSLLLRIESLLSMNVSHLC